MIKIWTNKKFTKLLLKNDYHLARTNGSHFIYTKAECQNISVPKKLNNMIARRLIKENKLIET